MKRILPPLIAGIVATTTWVVISAQAQCTGIFPNNSLCGNVSGSPNPPGIVNMAGTLVVGPSTSQTNDLALWANTAGTLLRDGTNTTSISGAYTWLGTQTYSATEIANGAAVFNSTFNATSSFQINGNAITWPNSTGTVMFLENNQTVAGNKTFGGTQNFTGTFQISGDQINVPAGQSGTVTLSTSSPTLQIFPTAGTGTYLTPSGVKWIRIRGVGGGGGGGGSGATSSPAGASGLATTFGTAFITANPGAGGNAATSVNVIIAGGLGGTVTIGAGATGIALQGGPGTFGFNVAAGGFAGGGKGADSCFGGGSPGGMQTNGNTVPATSVAAVPNTGSGGGGGAAPNNGDQAPGGGGGAGGCFDVILANPTTSFAFQVGAGGAGGVGTGTGAAGGQSGASGGLWIEEHYNP